MALKNEEILAKFAPHQRDAIERGGSTSYEGVTYTAEDFGLTAGSADTIGASVLNTQLSARITELEVSHAEKDKEIEDLKAQLAKRPGRKSKAEGEPDDDQKPEGE